MSEDQNLVPEENSLFRKEERVQDVIEVEKTVSPNKLTGAPKDFPAKDCPVFR